MATTIQHRSGYLRSGWKAQGLDVRPDGQAAFTVVVPVSDEPVNRILSKRLMTPAELNRVGERLAVATLRLAIRRLESLAREGRLDELPADQRDGFAVAPQEDVLLARMMRDKTCDYQLVDARDIYCSAAAPTDKTAVGTIGLRKVAPTNRAACNRCVLPDTDMVCSHLHHPRVIGIQLDQEELSRNLSSAACDRGRPEIVDPSRCMPGGHACWERVVEPTVAAVNEPGSPLMLHEAFDFLDVVWQLAFGKPLLRLKATAGLGRLVASPKTREEAMSAASDLAEIFAGLDIPDGVLDEASRKIPKGETLNRLEAALAMRPDTDGDRVAAAIRTLQAANQSRNGMQHTGAAAKGVAALARLGVDTPVTDWPLAWDRIRVAVANALGDLRDETRKVKPDAGTKARKPPGGPGTASP